MKRIVTMLLAAFALWAAAPAASQAQAFGCACLNNRVGQPIHFQYRIGNGPWQNRTLNPGIVYAFCHAYGAGPRTSPPLHFKLDRDAGPGSAWTDYIIQRVQTNTNQCAQVPAIGQYFVAFQPNTSNQLLMIGRVAAATAPPRPSPPQTTHGPMPGQSAFGCACLNNQTGQSINFRYRLGNSSPWKPTTLLAGNVYSFCTPFGAGPQSWAWLHFQFDRDMGPGSAWTDYQIARVGSTSNQCGLVPRQGHYFVRFQPGTNNQFLQVTR